MLSTVAALMKSESSLCVPTYLFSAWYTAYEPVVGNFKTFGRRQAVLLVVTSLAYYVCYHGLISSAKAGVPGGAYFDILCVCMAGQLVSIFSDFYGMLVFMLVSEWSKQCIPTSFISCFRSRVEL